MVGTKENACTDTSGDNALHQLRDKVGRFKAFGVQDVFVNIEPYFRREQFPHLDVRSLNIEQVGGRLDDRVDVSAGEHGDHFYLDEKAVEGVVCPASGNAEVCPVSVQDGPLGVVNIIPEQHPVGVFMDKLQPPGEGPEQLSDVGLHREAVLVVADVAAVVGTGQVFEHLG